MARTISMVSRVRRTGLSNATPCHPSITCGPLVPMPSRHRPPDSACSDCAVIASIAGVRAPSCAMPEPNLIVDVHAARYASGVNASPAQNSGHHAETTAQHPYFLAGIVGDGHGRARRAGPHDVGEPQAGAALARFEIETPTRA